MPSFCKPSEVTVPPDRFRMMTVDDPRVIKIAESMKEIGQTQAILISNRTDKVLRDGLTRLRACERLGRSVWFVTEDEGNLLLDNPLLVRVAEYQSNISRSDFTPQEMAAAIAEIDRLMREVYGSRKAGPGLSEGWTQRDTAEKLGYKSHRTVSEAITVSKAIEANIVPGIEKASTMQEAVKMVKETVRLKAAEELARRQAASGRATEIGDPLEWFGSKVILGNCLEKMKELGGGICSFFVTDPPWKIGIDKAVEDHGSSVQKAVGTYDDSSDAIIPLLKAVIPEMHRVGKPDCYVVMFCGAMYWLDLCNCFREAGFQVYNKPLVWVKTSAAGGLCSSKSPAPSIWPASITDFMILARKGAPVLAQLHKGDAFLCPPVPSQDKCHHSQKPIALLEEIISRLYHPGTNPLLIDPFCGSGSTLAAARRLGIRHYFGYELSPTNRDRAITYLVNQYMKEQQAEEDIAEDFE